MEIPLYILSALLATFLYAFGTVYTKLLLSKYENPVHLMIYQFTINCFVISLIFVCLIFLGFDFSSPFDFKNLSILIFSAVFIFLGAITFYHGLNIGKSSIGTVIISSRVLFVIPIGILFLFQAGLSQRLPITGWIDPDRIFFYH